MIIWYLFLFRVSGLFIGIISGIEGKGSSSDIYWTNGNPDSFTNNNVDLFLWRLVDARVLVASGNLYWLQRL